MATGIGVLGPLVVWAGTGEAVALRSTVQQRLVAVLTASRGRVTSADELIEALWGDGVLPAHPLAALQSQVHRVRRVLVACASSISTEGNGYRLECGTEHLDAARFEALVDQAREREAEPSVALSSLDVALSLWRGRAYTGVEDVPLVRADAERLEELRAVATEERAAALLACSRPDDAAIVAELLHAEHPYRERPVALAMRALSRVGRHVDALGVFDSFRRELGEELGMEVSPELRELEREILRHEGGGRAPPIGLPGNSFVGREVDLADVVDRASRSRLVTLTGPGGVGKTRLALHAAARLAQRFGDDVVLVELAQVDTAAGVASAIASALRVERPVSRTLRELVAEQLAHRHALVVLDNCEHVLDSAREVATTVLTRTAHVVMLGTSRQRLGVEGEQVLVVGPLAVPDDGEFGPAPSLFVERAAAAGAPPLREDDMPAVRALCARIGGLPLAIELAASRTRSHTPAQLLADLGGRIDRLADPQRATVRHRSIDATLDWSYNLLAAPERDLIADVAVFVGGFDVSAAAALTGKDHRDVADVLDVLVEHSLLSASTSQGSTRFSMLEPVRQYAMARLEATGELEHLRSRHARWFAEWAAIADVGLRSADDLRWRTAIDAELANLRAAHAWLVDHDTERAARLVGSLYWYAFFFAPAEVFAWADRTVRAVGDDTPSGGALAVAALGACRSGDLERGHILAEAGIAHARREPRPTPFVWDPLVSVEFLSGHYEQSLAARGHALELARAEGDPIHEAYLLAIGALSHGYRGELVEADADVAAARTLLATAGNRTVEAWCDYSTGEIRLEDAPADALPHLQRSLDTARHLDSRFLTGIAGVSAASCAARAGDPAGALATYALVIDELRRAGARVHLWTTVRTLIETLHLADRDEPAAILLGALRASASAPAPRGPDVARLDAVASQLGERLGHVTFTRLQAEGAALGDEQAIALALRVTAASDRNAARARPLTAAGSQLEAI